jgi:acyl-CoA reductase-like NAD-dependent aldehyde dehydrogenase
LTREEGKTLAESTAEVQRAADNFDHAIAIANGVDVGLSASIVIQIF